MFTFWGRDLTAAFVLDFPEVILYHFSKPYKASLPLHLDVLDLEG